jgi:hypothetical protein
MFHRDDLNRQLHGPMPGGCAPERRGRVVLSGGWAEGAVRLGDQPLGWRGTVYRAASRLTPVAFAFW